MADVKKIGDNCYTVCDFIPSHSEATFTVHFINGSAAVVERKKYPNTDQDWRAISSVQTYLLTHGTGYLG